MALKPPRIRTTPRNNIQGEIEVVVTNPNDINTTEIWYTTDGSDPINLVGNVPSPTYKIYIEPVVLTDTTNFKAQVVPMKHS